MICAKAAQDDRQFAPGSATGLCQLALGGVLAGVEWSVFRVNSDDVVQVSRTAYAINGRSLID